MARWLAEIGRPELLRTNGHFQVWFGPRSDERAAEERLAMERLGKPTARRAERDPASHCTRRSPVDIEEYARFAGLWFPGTGSARSSKDRAEFCRCRTSARRVFRVHRSPRHPAARGAGRPAYQFKDPDRRRGRCVHGCLDREPARAARLARADGKRTRLSRGDGGSSTARRHADPLCRTSASMSLRWKDDCAPPASWSLPETKPHPTREN